MCIYMYMYLGLTQETQIEAEFFFFTELTGRAESHDVGPPVFGACNSKAVRNANMRRTFTSGPG